MARQRKGAATSAPAAAKVPTETKEKKAKKQYLSHEDFDVIDGFVLENQDKLTRVLDGMEGQNQSGVFSGGLIAEYDGDISKVPPALVLAHYDRVGGFITKSVGGDQRVKIKNGSFWDVKRKRPRENPEVIYVFPVGSEFVEVDDPSKLAAAVTTINTSLAQQSEENEKRKQRAKRKSIIKGDIE